MTIRRRREGLVRDEERPRWPRLEETERPVLVVAHEAFRLQRLVGNRAVTTMFVQRDRRPGKKPAPTKPAPAKPAPAGITLSMEPFGSFPLLSFSQELPRVRPTDGARREGKPPPVAGEVHITIAMNEQTPKLSHAAAIGQPIAEATIKIGSRTVTLKSVFISGFSLSASGDPPVTTMTLNAAEITHEFDTAK